MCCGRNTGLADFISASMAGTGDSFAKRHFKTTLTASRPRLTEAWSAWAAFQHPVSVSRTGRMATHARDLQADAAGGRILDLGCARGSFRAEEFPGTVVRSDLELPHLPIVAGGAPL